MNALQKHTPGPWHAELSEPFTLGGDSREVVALDGNGNVTRGICSFMLDTDGHPNGKDFIEDVANAKLIAAAPELVAACDDLLELFGQAVFTLDDQNDKPMVENRLNAIRSAISKAKGQP